MFGRFVKKDGDTTVLFPFQRLHHSFVIGGFGRKFDAERELESNQNLRVIIGKYKGRLKLEVHHPYLRGRIST